MPESMYGPIDTKREEPVLALLFILEMTACLSGNAPIVQEFFISSGK